MNRILFTALAAFAMFAALADVGSKTYADYMKNRKRIVAREVVGDTVLTTFAQGRKTWVETNVIQRVAQRLTPIKYSKLKLIVAAKEAGKWDDVKAAIQAMNLEDEWNACQYITSDYPAYVAATNAVVSQGIATPEMVQAFMKMAEE